eukprot:ANDGO_07552.mRNA.1 hypothetical protein
MLPKSFDVRYQWVSLDPVDRTAIVEQFLWVITGLMGLVTMLFVSRQQIVDVWLWLLTLANNLDPISPKSDKINTSQLQASGVVDSFGFPLSDPSTPTSSLSSVEFGMPGRLYRSGSVSSEGAYAEFLSGRQRKIPKDARSPIATVTPSRTVRSGSWAHLRRSSGFAPSPSIVQSLALG